MYLGEGDQIRLPGDYLLRLQSFEFLQYADGRPKDWISTVEVEKNGKVIIDSFPLEVNRLLKVGSLKYTRPHFPKKVKSYLRTR